MKCFLVSSDKTESTKRKVNAEHLPMICAKHESTYKQLVLKYRCKEVGEEKVPDHLIPHGLRKRESASDHLVPKVEGQGKVFRVTLSFKKRMKRKSVLDPLVPKVEGQGKVFPVTKSPKRSKRKSVPEKKKCSRSLCALPHLDHNCTKLVPLNTQPPPERSANCQRLSRQ